MHKEKKKSPLSRLMEYTGNYRGLLYSGLFLSAISIVLGMAPYICIWLVIRDLVSVAPNWTQATEIAQYGWMAFAFAVGGILIYFFALMCTHLAAFRTASNIRKCGMAHLMKTPLGFFDNNASGLLRNRLDGAASETETLLAHNLADIVGTVAMFIAMLVLMFVFDWRTVEAADKIVVLKDGMVAEQGKPEDLMNTGGEFAKMVNLQSESAKWSVAEAVTNKR